MFPLVPTQDEPDQTLAAAIRAVREDREMTQEVAAAAAGVTLSSYSAVERGVSNPAWTTVVRIAEGLDVSMSELVRGWEGRR
jgi:transcriptional regulator with XRE-family HTH domain